MTFLKLSETILCQLRSITTAISRMDTTMIMRVNRPNISLRKYLSFQFFLNRDDTTTIKRTQLL